MKKLLTGLTLLVSMSPFASENLIGKLNYHIISNVFNNDPVATSIQTNCVKSINKVVINKSTSYNDPKFKSCDISYTVEDVNGKTQALRNYSSFDYNIPVNVQKKLKFVGIHPGWIGSLGMLEESPFQVYTETKTNKKLEEASMLDLTARCYKQVVSLINLSCTEEEKVVMSNSVMIKQRAAELEGAIQFLND